MVSTDSRGEGGRAGTTGRGTDGSREVGGDELAPEAGNNRIDPAWGETPGEGLGDLAAREASDVDETDDAPVTLREGDVAPGADAVEELLPRE